MPGPASDAGAIGPRIQANRTRAETARIAAKHKVKKAKQAVKDAKSAVAAAC